MPKKEQIRRMFDDIAPEYDAFNHLSSLGIDKCWRSRALRELPSPCREVLDIACGTGDFCIAAARRLAKKSDSYHITGADISTGMLEVMRQKVSDAGLGSRVSTEEGDCAALRFSDGSFDAVTVAFGVRNFENREKCLHEILRVLKPGGRFIMLELGVPSWKPVAWLYRLYFTKILPFVGGKMSGNRKAYEYLPASVLAFPKKREWLATLEKVGFSNCRHHALSLGICRLYTADKA